MNCQQPGVDFDDGGRAMMNGMTETAMPLTLDGLTADGDFEPEPRDRCNTWPLQNTVAESNHASPLIPEGIPEEGSFSGSNDNFDQPSVPPQQLVQHSHQQPHLSPSALSPGSNGASVVIANVSGGAGLKKNSARRNAWGNLSYADLITQAIVSSPEKRLTLSQIYDWMVQNVPYFRDKGDSNSSAGWKNSIRHNLSLHSRFVRIQNEGAGKSSWWVINPDAKPGKSSRRRTSTMPSGQDAMKASLEKKRRGVKKKIEQQRSAMAAAMGQGASASQGDILNAVDATDASSGMAERPDFGMASAVAFHTLSPAEFRHRSDSNLSNYSSVGNRLSPAYEDLELFDWETMNSSVPLAAASGDSGNELAASMNISMNLATDPPPPYSIASTTVNGNGNSNGGGAGPWRKPHQPRSGVSVSSSPLVHHQASPVKGSPSSTSAMVRSNAGYSPVGGVTVKTETPNYQELYPALPGPSSSAATSPPNCGSRPINGSSSIQTHLRNTLLIKKEAASTGHSCSSAAAVPSSSSSYSRVEGDYGYYTFQHHQHASNQPQTHFPHGNHVAAYSNAPPQILPTELSDIQYDNSFKNDIQCDIDQVIRHELSVAGKIDFNIGDNFNNI